MRKFEDMFFWYTTGIVVLGSWALVVLTIIGAVSSGSYAALLLLFIFLPLAVFSTAHFIEDIRDEVRDARYYRKHH